ncbi:DUF1552 domain-containing protein [Sorangium sp. So ce321]|uniref:DUF1552 domain-containing protein n=1 Tax=Sorangium sp. So ce321 TaxID=3133300 RepID=UPI003F62A42D
MNRRGPIDLRTQISRRKLLGGLSALTVALTSPIWRTSTVFGQDANQPSRKRFIGIFSANGTVQSSFFQPGDAHEAPLSLGPILAPLEEHKQRMLVLKGVHMSSTVEDELGVPSANKPGGPHMKGPGAMLTGGSLLAGSFTGAGGPAGWADRISVDQAIASRIGGDSQFPSLEFGVRIEGQEPLRVISYRGPNQPNIAVDDPFQMYSRIFANADLSDTELQRLIAERQSVLDFLKDDIGRLQKRVSSEDKSRLEAHLGGLRNIEQRLQSSAVSCTPLEMPEKFDPRAMENYPKVGRLQTDLMLLAHICGMTRVSTFMWANADSWQYYPWIGVNEEHHELSHAGDEDASANEKLVKINAWHSEQVKYVLDQLALAKEVDGSSVLDNTLLLWGNELGAGNTHTYKDIPWVLAGGAGGYFKMGRYMKYADLPHNNLLVSVCNAMGLDDVTTFGIPGVCTGALPGLVA